jgi:transposase InsO family protein
VQRARRQPCRLYAWKDRPACARRRRDEELLGEIRAIHDESKGTYGWPRICAELRHRGVHVSRKRVARLMRQAGLSGMVRRRKGRTTVSVGASPPRRISCAATSR